MVENLYFKIAYVLASYLLGSVLFGYIIVKLFKGGDLSKIDRPGTAGAGRQFGYKAGIPTFIFDVGKGVLVPLVARLVGLDEITMILATIAVLVGHNWPVFFKFRGGGGIATTIGIAAYLIPIIFLIVFGISLAVGFAYKYTLRKSHKVNPNVVASALGSFLLPLLCYISGQPEHITLLFVSIFFIIIIKGLILHFMYRNVSTAN